MTTTELKYLTYLNGYVQTRKPEQITWLDVFATFFALIKINILLISYNLKALIQHTCHMDFGFYLPSDLETFLNIVRTLKRS